MHAQTNPIITLMALAGASSVPIPPELMRRRSGVRAEGVKPKAHPTKKAERKRQRQARKRNR